MARHWTGDVKDCDLCGKPIISTTFIDGKVRGLGWALMCEVCWANFGSGLGVGRGQRYDTATKIRVEDLENN